jgi:hypothetical protein
VVVLGLGLQAEETVLFDSLVGPVEILAEVLDIIRQVVQGNLKGGD